MLAGESLKTCRIICQQWFTLMVFERITEAFGNRRGEPVARPNSKVGKTEATLVKNVPLVQFGSATG